MSDQQSGKSGLDKNTASALSYVLGPLTGVVFLVIENDPKVRFHAMQSIVVIGSVILLQMVLGMTLILAALIPLVSVVGFVLWLVLIYRAWMGDDWEVPVLGEYAKRLVNRVKK